MKSSFPFRFPPRQKTEAKRQTAKEHEKCRLELYFDQKRVFLYFIFLVDFKHWRKHKKIPKKQGLSQEDFAKETNVKYITLTKIEIGAILLKAIGSGFSKNRQGT